MNQVESPVRPGQRSVVLQVEGMKCAGCVQAVEKHLNQHPGVQWMDADLTNANLTNATLTNADLTKATLTNATLTNATLNHATLIDTNLTNAIVYYPTS